MTLTLSSTRLQRLQSAMRVVLSPLDGASAAQWYRDLLRCSMELMEADFASLLDPGGDEPVLHAEADGALVKSYVEHYAAMEQAMPEILRRRMEVGHPALVGHPDEAARGEFWTDFLVPNGLKGLYSLNTYGPAGPGPRLLLSMRKPETEDRVREGVAVLHLLAPAFRAGMQAARRYGDGGTFGRVLDGVGEAIALCTTAGVVVHRNPALVRLLGDDPDAARVMDAAGELARSIGGSGFARAGAAPRALAPGELRTRTGFYRLRATSLGDGVLGSAPLVAIAVEAGPRALRPAELRGRFGLTAREVEIAGLLAEGLTNAALARRLLISPHTTRHHTERVFSKLGVTSRARVGAILRGEAPVD